ncbi:MAG: hypothetical protein AAF724_15360 [Pseudomonadota bacterium]
MNFFFDNCTSPVLASTIDGFVRHDGHQAFHIREVSRAGLPLRPNASDTEWISALGKDSREWIVVTADRRISTVAAEKEAFRRAGLKGFLLHPAYQKIKVHKQARTLIWRWPELVDVIKAFSPPTLIGVPQSKSAKLNPLQW